MKKIVKLLLVAALATFAVNVSAQVLPTGLGFKLGYAYERAQFRGAGGTYMTRPQHGVRVGVFYDAVLLDGGIGLSLRPGVNYIYTGGRTAFRALRGQGYKDRVHTLTVPVDLKMFLGADKFKLYLFVGPRLHAGLSYKIQSSAGYAQAYTGKGRSSAGENTQDDPLLHRFNLSVGGGVGAEYMGAFLEIGYDWELLNGVRNKEANLKMYRRFLGLDLGYKF
jgi:hypothetical protein